MPLGRGFATVLVINTDQGFIRSNPQSQLLYGSASANIPTIQSLNGVALTPVNPKIPLAYVETAVTQGDGAAHRRHGIQRAAGQSVHRGGQRRAAGAAGGGLGHADRCGGAGDGADRDRAACRW